MEKRNLFLRTISKSYCRKENLINIEIFFLLFIDNFYIYQILENFNKILILKIL